MNIVRQVDSKEHKSVRVADGRRIEFDLRGVTSVYTDTRTYHIDFSWFSTDVPWCENLRTILIGLLSTHSIQYAHRCIDYASRFTRDLRAHNEPLSATLRLVNLRHWVEWYGIASWAFMQAVLGHWVRSKLTGIDDDIVDFLQSPEKWEEKDNGWYFALVANDPQRGALTEQELRSVQDGVNAAFQVGRISLRDWALAWFIIGTGVRPVQVARFTVGDIMVSDGPEGKEVTLAIPLAKGESGVSKDRWKRKAPTVLAEVLLRYLASEDMRGVATTAPLFFPQSREITVRVIQIFKRVETYSTRLEGPIPIFPYRFRYTMGTRALALGASDHEVARLLTHRTTWCIQYYRAAMPFLQAPIKAAIGQEMEFIAQAFRGRLIGGLDEATRRGEASALIRDFAHLMGQSIGACGTRAECHQDAPRACLGCSKFEPFIQAPWEDLLQILVADMEVETEDRIKLITLGHIEAVRGIIATRDRAREAS